MLLKIIGRFYVKKHLLIPLVCGAMLSLLIISGVNCYTYHEETTTAPSGMTESEIKSHITPENQLVKDCLQDILGAPPYQPSKDGFDLLRDWVANNIDYVSDEQQWGITDYWQIPEETLSLYSGDCEDFAFILCSLLRAYGISVERVYVAIGVDDEGYGHAFLMENWYSDGTWRALEPQAPTQVFPKRPQFNIVDAELLDDYEINAAFNDLYYYDEFYPWDED